MKVFLSASAEKDLLDGFAFYEMQQQRLGWYFLDSLYADIDALVLYGGIHAKPVAASIGQRDGTFLFPFITRSWMMWSP